MNLSKEAKMNLAEKMFARGTKSCPIRSDCKADSDRKYFDSLFEDDWEVFVVRRGNGERDFKWFTLCCEGGQMEGNAKRHHRAASGC